MFPLTPDPQLTQRLGPVGKSVHRRAMEAQGQTLAFCSETMAWDVTVPKCAYTPHSGSSERVLSWPVPRAAGQQRGRGRSLSSRLMCLTTGKEMEPVSSVSATGNGNETAVPWKNEAAVPRNATIKKHRWALGVTGSGEMSDLKCLPSGFYL